MPNSDPSDLLVALMGRPSPTHPLPTGHLYDDSVGLYFESDAVLCLCDPIPRQARRARGPWQPDVMVSVAPFRDVKLSRVRGI